MKIKTTLQALSLIPFITLGSISVAYGQISVSRSVIEFSKSAKVQDIEVVNKGENKVYLDLRLRKSSILNLKMHSVWNSKTLALHQLLSVPDNYLSHRVSVAECALY